MGTLRTTFSFLLAAPPFLLRMASFFAEKILRVSPFLLNARLSLPLLPVLMTVFGPREAFLPLFPPPLKDFLGSPNSRYQPLAISPFFSLQEMDRPPLFFGRNFFPSPPIELGLLLPRCPGSTPLLFVIPTSRFFLPFLGIWIFLFCPLSLTEALPPPPPYPHLISTSFSTMPGAVLA